jgi:hypothetical protein
VVVDRVAVVVREEPLLVAEDRLPQPVVRGNLPVFERQLEADVARAEGHDRFENHAAPS